MRILLSFILILLAISAFGTTYTAIAPGNWEDASTWSGGVIPPNTIPVGDTVVINGSVLVSVQTSNIINEGTITLGASSFIGTFNTSTFTNNATITLNLSIIGINGMSIFTNNATITLKDGSIQTYNTSTFTNNATITLDFSGISTNSTSTFTNNATITLNNNSFISTNGTSSFLTCDPAPVYSDMTYPNTGTNGSRIFDLSGGTATLAPLPSGCPTPAPIPTLSEWGLILLSMSLSIFGIVGMRQRVLV